MGTGRRIRREARGGFTLIEMMVVVSIIIILAGLVLSGLIGAKRRVKRAQTQQEIQNLKRALTDYSVEFLEYPPGAMDAAGNRPNITAADWNTAAKWWGFYNAGVANYTNEGTVWRYLAFGGTASKYVGSYKRGKQVSAFYTIKPERLITRGSELIFMDPYG